MKIFNLLFVLVLAVLSNITFAAEKTEVIVFNPDIPVGTPKEGKCWTESLAVARPNTWRCMVDNEISDPCFGTKDKTMVVCGADPLKKLSGFAVHLIEPLPQSNDVPAPNPAWKLLLADGSICSPYTGTLPFVDKQPIKFGCANACPTKQKCDKMAGLFSIDTQQPVWLAKKVIYSKAGQSTKVEKIEDIAIKTAWQ